MDTDTDTDTDTYTYTDVEMITTWTRSTDVNTDMDMDMGLVMGMDMGMDVGSGYEISQMDVLYCHNSPFPNLRIFRN